ncbi:hypothetical protein ACDX78_18365 [Virgibacillus oceani]
MKSIDMKDLDDFISKNKNEVEPKILRTKTPGKIYRTRPRDPDEIKILDRICQKRWKEAEAAGKVKYLSERVWYYEFD